VPQTWKERKVCASLRSYHEQRLIALTIRLLGRGVFSISV